MEDANPPVTPPPPVYTAPPPVIVPPGQPRPPKRGRGWMVFAIVLIVLLFLSVLVNFGLAGSVVRVGGSRSVGGTKVAGPRLDETILEDNHATAKIAVIDVDGVITGSPLNQQGYSMVDVIKEQLDTAQEDSRVKAVI